MIVTGLMCFGAIAVLTMRKPTGQWNAE
jgi:hypothetical protein